MKQPPSRAFLLTMAVIVALLGLGNLYWGFQSEPPEARRWFGFVADLLGSWKVAGMQPLFFVVGGFLLFEAWRMASGKGRYSRD